MNSITNNISKMLNVTTSDMPIYVAGDDDLVRDIKNGWPAREVKLVERSAWHCDGKGMLITADKNFYINFGEVS